MLGRPNLPRLHCTSFRVYFHVHLSPSVAEEVFRGTVVYETDEGRRTAYFGKLYHADGGTPHVAEATIYLYEEGNYHVTLYLGLEDRDKPPNEIKSPDKLMNLLRTNGPAETGEISVNAEYTYAGSEGWRTHAPLPIEFPRPMKLGRGLKFTHFDGMRLTNVEDGKSVDVVDIKHTDQGDYIHQIGLRRRRAFSERMIGSLLREGARLSLSLMVLEEPSDGN